MLYHFRDSLIKLTFQKLNDFLTLRKEELDFTRDYCHDLAVATILVASLIPRLKNAKELSFLTTVL